MLWLLLGIGQASVIQCQFSRGNGELGITIQTLQSMRREKFSGLQPEISPPQWALNIEVSKLEMRVIPLFSVRIPFQKFSTPIPMHVIGPIPVITERLLFMRRNSFLWFPDTFSYTEAFDWRCDE